MTNKTFYNINITSSELQAFKMAVNTLNLLSIYYDIPELDIKAERIENKCNEFLARNHIKGMI